MISETTTKYDHPTRFTVVKDIWLRWDNGEKESYGWTTERPPDVDCNGYVSGDTIFTIHGLYKDIAIYVDQYDNTADFGLDDIERLARNDAILID